jgi:hypothetical protein
MTTFKAKIGESVKFILAEDIMDAYKRVEMYHKNEKIVITSARKRCNKVKNDKLWC